MLLLERQPIYWRFVDPELEDVNEELWLTIDDYILGPFDTECLSSHPPESDWSDWFPPPRPITEWELYQLTDWVEIEAENHELFPDPYTHSFDYFFVKEKNVSLKYSYSACSNF